MQRAHTSIPAGTTAGIDDDELTNSTPPTSSINPVFRGATAGGRAGEVLDVDDSSEPSLPRGEESNVSNPNSQADARGAIMVDDDDDDDQGHMVRAHTTGHDDSGFAQQKDTAAGSAGATVVPAARWTAPFPRMTTLGNYSLVAPGVDSYQHAPRGHKLALLRRPLAPRDQSVWDLTFEEWRRVDRSALPGYRCPIGRPLTLDRSCVPFPLPAPWTGRVYVVKGAVQAIAVDAIVNAANEGCMGGGGVDGAIHDDAGPLLVRECATFDGCATGHTRITKGYNLPARFVLHIVGPMGERPADLRSCYESCIELLHRHGLTSIAFCCVSTGIFGYPLKSATTLAIATVLRRLANTTNPLMANTRVVFACFRSEEHDMYTRLMPGISQTISQETGSAVPRTE